MKVWSILGTIWIWWTVIIGHEALVGCSLLSSVTEGGGKDEGGQNNLSYDEIEFSAVGCTKESYNDFIRSLRRHLSNGTHELYGIPLMRARSDPQQLLLVKLHDWNDEPITLVLDLVNAYVLAYQAKNRYYVLNDTSDHQLYGSNPYKLHFDGNYPQLERVANISKEDISVGINELAGSVLNLFHWSPPQNEKSVASSLLVFIQMISEAARFTRIENRIAQSIANDYASFPLGVKLTRLETKWEDLCKAVQGSDGGVFRTPVSILPDQEPIKNAVEARTICGLALLLKARNRQSQELMLSPPHDSSSLPSSLRNII